MELQKMIEKLKRRKNNTERARQELAQIIDTINGFDIDGVSKIYNYAYIKIEVWSQHDGWCKIDYTLYRDACFCHKDGVFGIYEVIEGTHISDKIDIDEIVYCNFKKTTENLIKTIGKISQLADFSGSLGKLEAINKLLS